MLRVAQRWVPRSWHECAKLETQMCNNSDFIMESIPLKEKEWSNLESLLSGSESSELICWPSSAWRSGLRRLSPSLASLDAMARSNCRRYLRCKKKLDLKRMGSSFIFRRDSCSADCTPSPPTPTVTVLVFVSGGSIAKCLVWNILHDELSCSAAQVAHFLQSKLR